MNEHDVLDRITERLRKQQERAIDQRRRERLGNNASRVSKQAQEEAKVGPDEQWFVARDEQLKDRTVNYYLFGEFDKDGKRERVANCGRVRISTASSIVVKVGESGVGSFSGYQTCGSIHACPICAAKIRQHRSNEITIALRKWLNEGNFAFSIALTTPHDKEQTLEELYDCITRSWKGVLSGGARKKFFAEEHVAGTIRANDLTHGFVFGWHPHLHNLILIENHGQDVVELEKRVKTYFEKRWSAEVRRQGYGEVNLEKGIHLDRVKDEEGLGAYISKVSYDLTRSDKKEAAGKNRNPWQLLRDAQNGDAQAMALWKEYVLASKGKRAIEWSRGLRLLILGYDDEDAPSDEEIAAQLQDDLPLAELGPSLASLIGNRVHVKIACLRGVEHNGADGLRYVLQHDLKLSISVEWTQHTPRGSPEGTEPSKIPYIELV